MHAASGSSGGDEVTELCVLEEELTGDVVVLSVEDVVPLVVPLDVCPGESVVAPPQAVRRRTAIAKGTRVPRDLRAKGISRTQARRIPYGWPPIPSLWPAVSPGRERTMATGSS